MAGAISFGDVTARIVVVTMSSAIPPAIFPMTFAEAGATRRRSQALAAAICSTSYLKFLSKVSTRHLLPVSVSKVIGVMNFAPFAVSITVTVYPFFIKPRAMSAAL